MSSVESEKESESPNDGVVSKEWKFVYEAARRSKSRLSVERGVSMMVWAVTQSWRKIDYHWNISIHGCTDECRDSERGERDIRQDSTKVGSWVGRPGHCGRYSVQRPLYSASGITPLRLSL